MAEIAPSKLLEFWDIESLSRRSTRKVTECENSDVFEEESDLEVPKEVPFIEEKVSDKVENQEQETLEVQIEEPEAEKTLERGEKVDFSIVSKRELEAELDKVGEVVEKGRLYISDNRRDVILYRLLAPIQTPQVLA